MFPGSSTHFTNYTRPPGCNKVTQDGGEKKKITGSMVAGYRELSLAGTTSQERKEGRTWFVAVASVSSRDSFTSTPSDVRMATDW